MTVPDELIAAARAAFRKPLDSTEALIVQSPEGQAAGLSADDIRLGRALEAFAARHKQMVRQQIAEEIEKARQKISDQEGVCVEDAVRIGSICNGMSRAAQIARGEADRTHTGWSDHAQR